MNSTNAINTMNSMNPTNSTNSIPVVILCGGMGMRLAEYTEIRPKLLVRDRRAPHSLAKRSNLDNPFKVDLDRILAHTEGLSEELQGENIYDRKRDE